MQITFDHVTYVYRSGISPALQALTLEFETTPIVGVCGVAGSGKTTFIQHINGMLTPCSGRVRINGEDIHRSKETLRQIRQRIGMTFQFPEHQLFGRTVWEELSYTLVRRQCPEQEIEPRVSSVCEQLQLDLQQLRNRSPFSLSRADQRKLGIAVILALQPEMIIFDEPTAGLDRTSAYQLLDLLQALHRHNNLEMMLVSHDLELFFKYADVLILLAEGKVVCTGSPLTIITAADQLEQFGISLPPVNRTLRLLQAKYPQIDPGMISAKKAVAEIITYLPKS